jgi:hypothetical protein
MKELWHTFENIKSQKNLKDVKHHLMTIDQWQKWLKMLKSWFLPVLGGYHKYLRTSLGHLSLILSGYHHEWHPDWKSSYRFPLMWESDVKTSFSTVYSHYKWNIQPGKSGASRCLTGPTQEIPQTGYLIVLYRTSQNFGLCTWRHLSWQNLTLK